MKVYKKTEQLLYKIYPRLVNFPKSEKFSLCQSIKNNFFDLLKFISYRLASKEYQVEKSDTDTVLKENKFNNLNEYYEVKYIG